MIQLILDEGWDEKVVSGISSKAFRRLNEVLLSNNLVTYSHGNTYIYLCDSNYWSVFVSAEAQKQLCDITGSDNVSVSYLTASMPYISYLEKRATRSTPIPTSICIGTWRMCVFTADNKNKLLLKKARDIVPIPETIQDERVGSFCIMPCSFNYLPESWTSGGEERIYNFLSVLFQDSLDLNTIMWIIGNSVLDPETSSKFLLLYGPGGTGKSTLIKVIEQTLKGCCSTIKPSTFTNPKEDISFETCKAVASNRFITAGEINLETNKLNLHNLKVITGHDTIPVPPLNVTTRCSIVAGCNHLPNPLEQKSWCSSAISRRIVVVLMNVRTDLLPKYQIPDSVEDIQDFLLSCVNIRLKNPSMPITTKSLLYTLLGNIYDTISDKIEICDNPSDQETMDCNTELDIYLNLELHTLGELASIISPTSVKVMATINFIKNIRLILPLK